MFQSSPCHLERTVSFCWSTPEESRQPPSSHDGQARPDVGAGGLEIGGGVAAIALQRVDAGVSVEPVCAPGSDR